MKLSGLLFLVIFLTRVNSLVVVDSTLASACVYYLNTYDWGCGSHGNGMRLYMCRCANVDWLGSVTNCIVTQSNTTRLVDHALRHISGRCLSKAHLDYSVDDLYGYYHNASTYLQDPDPVYLDTPAPFPLRTDRSEWMYYYKSFKDFAFEVQKSQWFGWGLVFYWATVLTIATLWNINNRYIGLKLNSFLKRNLALPSTFQNIKNIESSYKLFKFIPIHIPTRLDSIVILIFILQTIITCCVGYTLELPNAFINRRWFMNLDLISYRTDLMSMSLFPIIYIFGIRNNPFIPITGISFSTFNVYHKWNAYVMTTLAFIHSIIWTVDAIKDGGYKVWVLDLYFQYGIAAMVLLALLVAQSGKFVRDLMYEVFLVFHKLFNIFFIVTMYYHCNTLGWMGWIWSMAGILVFDRVCRILRIILNGGVQSSKMIRCSDNVIKLVLNKPRFVKYQAGHYLYLYFSSPWYYCWQSHPFTIISSPVEDGDHLVVYFKLQKGITNRIIQRLIKTENDELNLKVMVEGPYGNTLSNTSSQKSNDTFVGLAGGLGIASIFPHFIELLQNEPIVERLAEEKYDTNSSTATTSTGDISTRHKLYWIINNLNHVQWFKKELDWLLSHHCAIDVVLTSNMISEEKISHTDLNPGTNFIYSTSRPDFTKIISEEFEKSSSLNRDIEVLTCGPSLFNDDVRSSVVEVLKANKSAKINLEYHAESFTW